MILLPLARRPHLPLALLLLTTTGCSGVGFNQLQEFVGNVGQPGIEELADLSALCEDPGEGYSEAAEYTGDGPHPTVMFNAAPGADTDPKTEPSLAAPHPGAEDDASPIVSWHPDTPEEAALLVCAESQGTGEELHTCEYRSWDDGETDSTLPLHSQGFSFTVYELATGETLHQSDFTAMNGQFFGSGLTSECPTAVQYETFPSELYAAPSAEELHAELSHVVEGAAS